jgi:hypothetical protein
MPKVRSKLIAVNHLLFLRLTISHYLFNIILVSCLTLSPKILLGFVSYFEDGGDGFLRNVYAYLSTWYSIMNGNLLNHRTENLEVLLF